VRHGEANASTAGASNYTLSVFVKVIEKSVNADVDECRGYDDTRAKVLGNEEGQRVNFHALRSGCKDGQQCT
jgi:hypothetical protein